MSWRGSWNCWFWNWACATWKLMSVSGILFTLLIHINGGCYFYHSIWQVFPPCSTPTLVAPDPVGGHTALWTSWVLGLLDNELQPAAQDVFIHTTVVMMEFTCNDARSLWSVKGQQKITAEVILLGWAKRIKYGKLSLFFSIAPDSSLHP